MRIYIQNIMADIIIWKRNKIDISVIENVIAKEEMKRGNTNINIGDGSWKVSTVGRRPGKSDPIRMMACAHKQFAITIQRTWDFANFRPGRFLDKKDIELILGFKDGVDDDGVLVNVLQKNLEIFHNHWLDLLFTAEQSDFDLFSRISAYFLTCHSLLKQCLQKGQLLESAWWSPLQFEHLKEWGHGSPFLVSNLGGLILALPLQHQPNSLWCSDLWGPLHLTHFAPWILHENIE